MSGFSGYDIIGDIHGHASALEALLERMGYFVRNGVLCHPERQAIFVGDYVDRGDENLRTCQIAMDMVEAKTAQAIMGNHEFNHIAMATPDPDHPGAFLREHNKKNLGQAAKTLREFESEPEMRARILDWMRSLPLWLELPGIRIVHACWSPAAQDALKPMLCSDNSIKEGSVGHMAKVGAPMREFREALLNGPEFILPDEFGFVDPDGNTRNEVRLKWWLFDDAALHLTDAVHVVRSDKPSFPDIKVPLSAVGGADTDERPVVFGHYWMRFPHLVLGERHVCVDASIAVGGNLAAYRFSGEKQLKSENVVIV